MRLRFVVFLSILFVCSFSQAQVKCPKNKTTCYGECGRFVDENGDELCDIGTPINSKPKSQTKGENIVSKNQVQEKQPVVDLTSTAHSISESITTETISVPVENDDELQNMDAKVASKKATEQEEVIVDEVNPEVKEKPYRLVSITIITLLAYFFTMFLVKRNVLRKASHRKIWNFLLLITFLMSCLLGFLLVIQLNYGVLICFYLINLKLHVEFGIAMTLIAFIHILWHLPYFKRLFGLAKHKDE